MNPIAAVRRRPELAVILVAQAVLVAVFGRNASTAWPHSDAQTYFAQAVMLWQGLFPPDPARPIFYPFFLSLGLGLLGLRGPAMVAWQALPLLLTTALVYRLGLVAAGRKAAVVATGAFALFPGSLLYGSLFFYREGLTAMLLAATANLLELMLCDPDRRARAFYAGVPAGCLTLIKPEFGSLMAALALTDLTLAWRDKVLRRRVAPWLVCGLTAVAVTLPVVALDRRVFGEWFYINTYKGFNYYLSYCDGGREPPELVAESFQTRDHARYDRAHRTAIDIMFLAPASVPFVERDRRLGRMARECIAADPGGAGWKYLNRLREALFGFYHPIGELRSGLYGDWSPVFIQSLRCSSLFLQVAAIVLLLPAVPLLARCPAGRIVLVALAWYVGFYASVVYMPRFKVAVWPALAVAAGAGWINLKPILRQNRAGRAALAVWLVTVAIFSVPSTQGEAGALVSAENWRERLDAPVFSAREKRNNLIELAGSFIEAKNRAGLEREMGRYIRDRRESLNRDILIDAGNYFSRLGYPDGSDFFQRMANELYPAGTDPAAPPVSP